MHTEYFKLRRRPFEILPDSDFLYLSEQHARAINNIKFALANKDCFVVVTGEIGVGKTTILNTVLKQIGDDMEMARLTHTSLSPVELLQAVLLAFGQPVEHESKVLLVDQIRRFLLDRYSNGKHVVIAVDEAQNLGAAALEELRLLTCIEADKKELLTVVLMGQPTLSDLINSEELHNLKQRTRLRQHLRRLTLDETTEYVKHRLSVTGGDCDQIFEPEAVAEIHGATLGTPRLINTLCDTALTAAAVREMPRVTVECVAEVLEELGWQGENVFSTAPQEDEDLPVLTLTYRGQLLRHVACLKPMLAIGRCASNHLQIDDQSVSRRHAIISFESGRFCIEDLGSKNGTWYNGQDCGRRRLVLHNGDEITIGRYQLIFRQAGNVAEIRGRGALEDTSSVRTLNGPAAAAS